MPPPYSYLPKLLEGNNNNVATPSQPGVWDEKQGYKRMGALAEAIDAGSSRPAGSKPAAGSAPAAIHSIPDPWARVILFTRALYAGPTAGEPHPLHFQVRGEWRGLLALLALRERMGMTGLSAHRFEFPDKPNPGFFSDVLGRVLPNDGNEIIQGESWSSVYILKYTVAGASGDAAAGVPFALTSPATLVATGADYPDAMTEAEVPWFRLVAASPSDPASARHMLTDPADVLSTEEKRALAEWLRLLHHGIGERGPIRNDRILGSLKEFINDLDPAAPLLSAAILAPNRRLGLSFGVANLLESPLRPAETHLSHLVIETDAAPPDLHYVLVDPAVAPAFGKDPKEVVVHRGITLATHKSRIPNFGVKVNGRPTVNGEFDEANVLWLAPEYFFQPFLIYDDPGQQSASAIAAAASNPFPGCRPVHAVGASDPRRILLPLNEDVTRLFTADYIQSNFSVEWKNNGETVCRLRLKLRSVPLISLPDGGTVPQPRDPQAGPAETRDFEISKTYTASAKQLVKAPFFLPAVGLWPNVRSTPPASGGKSPWQRYYLFETWHGTNTRMEDFVVKPLKSAAPKFRKSQSGPIPFYIHELSAFPDFLTCEMASQTVDNYQFTPKGLMLLADPKVKTPVGTREAALGIDFGTTGTSIYWAWKESEPEPRQMNFANRMWRITNYDVNRFVPLTRDLMLPAQDWSAGKILSVYQVFRESDPGHPLEELLDGHVLFANEESPETFIAGNHSGIRADLKWGDDRQNEAADGFLTQLCFQSLLELIVEGASKVELRYSYPTAFSFDEKDRFDNIWNRVIARAEAAVGIPFGLADEDQSGDEENKENCEAIAATRYFSKTEELAFPRGALTLDIGGGTTDLALWSNDKKTDAASLMAHLSVKFAGRDIFLKAVRDKPDVLKVLYPPLPIDLPDRQKNRDAFNAQLDALIFAHGEKMLEGLPGKEDKPGVKELLAVMGAGLCGVAFYTGLLIGRLAQLDVFVPVDRLPIFVGGNGSRLLKWCAINSSKPQHSFYKKFGASVLAGCRIGMPGLDVKVEINRSKQPKQEVAFGLVAYGPENVGQIEIKPDYTNPLAGESFLVLNAAKGLWSDTPSPGSVRAKAVSVDPEMPIFRAFLAAAEITLSNRTLSRVLDKTNTRLKTLQAQAASLSEADAKKALDPFKKEPIFIIAVKSLLDIPLGEWLDE